MGYDVPTTSNPADYFIEVAFGFEMSSKKLGELPTHFGLRCSKVSVDDNGKETRKLEALPELDAASTVRADSLGVLWGQWYRTSTRSLNAVMKHLEFRADVGRRFFVHLFKQREKKRRRGWSVSGERRPSITTAGEPKRRHRGSISLGRFDPRQVGVNLDEFQVWFKSTAPQPSYGLKWNRLEAKPITGVELKNDGLAAKLQEKTECTQAEFTQAEWDTFGIKCLRTDNFIQDASQTHYFEPAGDKPDWGFGETLRPHVSKEIWKRAKQAAEDQIKKRTVLSKIYGRSRLAKEAVGVLPSWHQLRDAMESATLPTSDRPNWFAHFWICLLRYSLKLLRTRSRIYALVGILVVLGVLCGALHGAPPGRNDLVIYYMMFNTLFSVVCATSTSATFGGGNKEFFAHEGVSGVRQTAEGLARMLADLVWLALLPMTFILTLRTFAALRMELYSTWFALAWAVSPLGYVFTLVAPANANVLTATVVVLMCTLANGFFGITAKMAGDAIWLSPGYTSFLLVSFGACVAEPFDTTRWFVMSLLWNTGVIPQGMREISEWEDGTAPWREDALLSLFLFGLVMRALALLFFWMRSHVSLGASYTYWRTRAVAACGCCRALVRTYQDPKANLGHTPSTERQSERISELTGLTMHLGHVDGEALPRLSEEPSSVGTPRRWGASAASTVDDGEDAGPCRELSSLSEADMELGQGPAVVERSLESIAEMNSPTLERVLRMQGVESEKAATSMKGGGSTHEPFRVSLPTTLPSESDRRAPEPPLTVSITEPEGR